MEWKTVLAYITGTVDQELLLRNEYLVAENRILRNQITGRVQFNASKRSTLAELGKWLEKQALAEMASVVKPGLASDKNVILEMTASYLKLRALKCLFDVKDRGEKFEDSSNCQALGMESLQYARVGGWELDSQGYIKDSYTKHALNAEQARTLAWRARAISAAGDPPISIW